MLDSQPKFAERKAMDGAVDIDDESGDKVKDEDDEDEVDEVDC